MSNCIYCQKPAGFLSKKHDVCESNYEQGCKSIKGLVSLACANSDGVDSIIEIVGSISAENHINAGEEKAAIVAGWERAVNHIAETGLFSKKQEHNILKIKNDFYLSEDDLDKNGAYTKFSMALVLQELFSNRINEYNCNQNHPFAIKRTEKLIYVFNKVNYYNKKENRLYLGIPSGKPKKFEIGKVYPRGLFSNDDLIDEKDQIKTISEVVRKVTDFGALAITTERIIFYGTNQNFSIEYNEMMAIKAFSDGIGLVRNDGDNNSLIFNLGDGWFAYNIIRHLTRKV